MRRIWLGLLLVGCGNLDAGDQPGDSACNSLATDCSVTFDQLTLVMTHNAMSSAELDWSFPNQNWGMARQLEDGVRGFMLDTHIDSATNEPALCHSFCALGSTPLVDGLRIFTEFLDNHPSEVLVFMIQNGISAEDTAQAFREADLERLTWAQPAGAPWPTLSEMIETNRRLVVFHEGGGTGPDWYMDGYADYVWDNDYRAETPADFGCEPYRGSADHSLFLLNHFLTAPLASADLSQLANEPSVVREHMSECAAAAGQPVNWISVDFYDIGDVVQTVQSLREEDP